MTPQGKGIQIGGAIAAALCAAFAARWLMMPAQAGWRLSADGSAWEASRDVHGAAILPERLYRVTGRSTAGAEITWSVRAPEDRAPERTGAAGAVAAGAWTVVAPLGNGAPRRASVLVHVTPASAVDAASLMLELVR